MQRQKGRTATPVQVFGLKTLFLKHYNPYSNFTKKNLFGVCAERGPEKGTVGYLGTTAVRTYRFTFY